MRDGAEGEREHGRDRFKGPKLIIHGKAGNYTGLSAFHAIRGTGKEYQPVPEPRPNPAIPLIL
jgi:hypothetical protein